MPKKKAVKKIMSIQSEFIFLNQTWKEEYFEILETWEPSKPFYFLCSTLYHDKINKVPNQEYQQSSK